MIPSESLLLWVAGGVERKSSVRTLTQRASP
jgi:hypothetical protein